MHTGVGIGCFWDGNSTRVGPNCLQEGVSAGLSSAVINKADLFVGMQRTEPYDKVTREAL
jgi:hypothetical protein